VLEVVDDGRGLAATTARPDAFGILGMRERAAAIGARLEIVSPPGTTVRCEIEGSA
jgi:signal transduction histidine kinase